MRPREISPSKDGEGPGLPEGPDSEKAQKKSDKGGWDRSSAALLACGRSALDQVLEAMLVLTVSAQAWFSEMYNESHWAEQEQEPSRVCGHTTPPVRAALPAVRIKQVHHGQLPHHGKCLTDGFWKLEPTLTQLYSKIHHFVQLLKMTFRISYN